MDNILPASRDAEEAVIGSLLLDPDVLMRVLPILGATGDKFTMGNLGHIYEAIVEMDAQGDGIDLVTLTELLDKKPATMGKKHESLLDQVGGPAALTGLINATPTSIHVETYAKAVRDSHTVRRVIAVAAEVTQLAYQHQDDPDYVLGRAEKAIYDIRGDRPSDVHPTRDLGLAFQDYIQRKIANPDYTPGFKSTITNMDEIIGGLERNKLITIAGRPSFGKTAVATFIAWHLVRQGNPTLLFSLEMSSSEMMRRFISLITGINSEYLKSPGKLIPEDMAKVQEALGAFIDNKYPLYLSFGAKNVMEIRAHARRVSAQALATYGKPLAAVIVDYLQLLSKTPGSKAERRDLEIGEISRTLKLMSLEDDLNCLCVEVSQLSRAVESRTEKRPILPDLRDCLPGNALITNADTGERISVQDIVRKGLRFQVWSLGDCMKLIKSSITDAWRVGEETVYRLTTRLGYQIECSSGHRFLTATEGWKKLSQLSVGSSVALPRACSIEPIPTMTRDQALLLGWLIGDGWMGGSPTLTVATQEEADFASSLAKRAFGLKPRIKPEHARTSAVKVVMTTGFMCGAGKNPLTNWLKEIGAWGSTGVDKHVPEIVFRQPSSIIAAFLTGLFHADGSARATAKGRLSIKYDTISPLLASQVHHLLLRLGVISSLHRQDHSKSGWKASTPHIWEIGINGDARTRKFVDSIGFLGAKQQKAQDLAEREKRNEAGTVDRLPREVTECVANMRRRLDLSHSKLGYRTQGKRMSRERAIEIGQKLNWPWLEQMGTSDIVWDEIVAIEKLDSQNVYDIEVVQEHNLVASDFITHNSGNIEQDSDIVIFTYPPLAYETEEKRARALKDFEKGWEPYELIVAKNRDGPIGIAKCMWRRDCGRIRSVL